MTLSRSVVVSQSSNPDEGPIYRHVITQTENGGHLISTFRSLQDCTTTCDLLKGALIKYRDCRCVGTRIKNSDGSFGKYEWLTYQEFYEQVINFALGLNSLGLRKGDKIGIYSVNSMWWQTTAYACHVSSLIPVPIYDSLGPDAAQYIISHSECKIILVQPEKLESLTKALPNTPSVEKIILVSDEEHEDINGIPVYFCKQIVDMGKSRDEECLVKPSEDDIGIIMYTSGSTGKPKGCVLTHRNLIAGATGLGCLGTSITTKDTYYSFLPLAHIYEMGVEIIMISQGAAIGFYSGSVKNLMNDLQTLQPTIICGVPRVWNRISSEMKKKIEVLPGILKFLVKSTLSFKQSSLKSGIPHSLLLDSIFLKKFRDALGGKVRLIVSGGAPILPDVYEFLCSAITPNIVQGYGLTEVAASVAVSEIPALDPLSNGAVSQAGEIKLRKVPGLQYDPHADIPTGEILIRGPQVFKGYYKDDELTKEVLDEDGWFATGDIGMITKEGTIQIIDRIKQLVKLSQGEYISITTLTDTYGTAKDVQNIYIYADSHHDCPLAVVVPTRSIIDKYKISKSSMNANQELKEELIKNLNDVADAQKLRRFERLSNIVIDDEEFTVENGLLTPSMKPQWQSLRSKYEKSLVQAFE